MTSHAWLRTRVTGLGSTDIFTEALPFCTLTDWCAVRSAVSVRTRGVPETIPERGAKWE